MTQISVLQGIITDSNASVLDAVPYNLYPTIIDSSVSKGYLSSAPGLTSFSNVETGRDRAAFNWNGVMYRVQGTKLISVDSVGAVTILGDVGDDGFTAFMDNGVTQLAISSNLNLYYWDGVSLVMVTDPFVVNTVKSMLWIDGYFLFTDGITIINMTLANPLVANPTSYGTAETDPDGIYGLIKIRNELFVMGVYTIQALQNVGGSGFPFANNPSAFVPKGTVGPKAFCEFNNVLAFVGRGKDEAVDIYLCSNAETVAISSNIIADILQKLNDEDLFNIVLEKVVQSSEQRLLIHLSNKTLVYHYNASQENGKPVWTILAGGSNANVVYPVRNFTFCYNKYIGASDSTGRMAYLDYDVSTHFNIPVGWSFVTNYIYNDGGFTVTSVELIATTGRTPLGIDPRLFFSYSRDGCTYSQEQSISQGKQGQFNQRLQWRPMCRADNYMSLKFRGLNTSIASIMRLEADIEGQLK